MIKRLSRPSGRVSVSLLGNNIYEAAFAGSGLPERQLPACCAAGMRGAGVPVFTKSGNSEKNAVKP